MSMDGTDRGPVHILLTVLGTKPQTAQYALADREVEAPLAPLALLDLLPLDERPNHVVALCTSEARCESLPPLVEKCRTLGRIVEAVDVPSGHAQRDIDTYLERVSAVIPRDREVDLTLDITHGYRHFSFLTYTAVLYLSALRGVRVRGAYYGMLRRDEVSPFLDLRPLLALPRWLHALQVLRETGSAVPIAAVLREEPATPLAIDVARELSDLSEAYLSGLPIELGRGSRRFREQRQKPLEELLRRDHGLPLAGELVEWITGSLGRFALADEVSGDGWKRQVTLSRRELERQARLIDDLLERESLATAVGLMNEWTVSWASWRRADGGGWLDYKNVRRRAAGLLGAIAAIVADADLADLRPILTDEQRALGAFWTRLRELRNAYHHHGMRPAVLVGNPQIDKTLAEVRSYWTNSLRVFPGFSLALDAPPRGRILVSPIGMRPGVLFSAVMAARTDGQGVLDTCVVVCSRKTEMRVDEALNHAGFHGPIERLVLEDPYGGRPEIDRLVRAARQSLVGADEVIVNVTGGTTLMGLIAEALADAARGLARPVRRFGLIDRRSPEQQDADPYRVGEPFWLDVEEGSHVDQD